MAKVLITDTHLTNIANAIREKNGEVTSYKPSEMAEAITNISGGDSELEASYLSSIDGSLGANCTKLPDGLTAIGANAFRELTNLKLNYLPDTIESVGAYAFGQDTTMQLSKLPDALKTVGEYAFFNCSGITANSLPEGITEIGKAAFYGCANFTASNIPNGLTIITENSFAHSGVTFSIIPETVTTIEKYAFIFCPSITSLTILSPSITIGADICNSCTNLERVVIPNVTTVPSIGVSPFFNTKIGQEGCYIYVPDDLVDTFKVKTYWKDYADSIKPISELPTE